MVKLIDHLLAARDRRNFRDLEHRPLVYILQGITPVPSAGLEWAHWFETHMDERQVGWTIVEENVSVSTVFLGVDFAHVGPPILFETMVLGGPLNGEIQRYPTWEAAERGHMDMVALVRSAILKRRPGASPPSASHPGPASPPEES